MLWYWKNLSFMPAVIADEAHGWLGPYFNLLPLFTVALFILQQKMFTPPATDDQTRMQQQMMTYMTVFMGIMFYKVPAGLCLYFITSSLWSVIERKLIHKPKPGEVSAATTAKPETAAPAKTTNGSPQRRPGKKQKKR
jgi:YidC/Oxa1 family membrane protein insertase